MNDIESTIARVHAWSRGRAVPVRETSAVAPDPENCVGIASIRVVTEDHVQALAYGSLDAAPVVTSRIHPLGRDTGDLESFADWLVRHVQSVVRTAGLVRLWVPHGKTIETLEILGRRYENNRNATPTLREAARLCRILAEETRYSGQQTVAVALDTILAHLVTGQMPIEDQHLGAVLAWADPPPGSDPRVVANDRSRLPASGILVNTPDQRDDDRVEFLRTELKSASGNRYIRIQRGITDILEASVMREWDLLCCARRCFWGLGLAQAGLDELTRASSERVSWAVENHLISPRRAVPLTRKLEEHEHAIRRSADAAIASDGIVRNRAARLGRVINGLVVHVDQPRSNHHPCHVVLRTTQTNLRVRLDDRVYPIGYGMRGIVRDIRPEPSGGGSMIRIEVKTGVRGAHELLGQRQEWVESRDFPLLLRQRALTEAASRGTWILDDTDPPVPRPRRSPGGDLLEHAHTAERRR